MRRALVFVLFVGLVAASTALADRGDPQERFTKADQARAKAMLLRRSDFNAAFASRPSSNDASDFYCAALDESDLTLTGQAYSPNFTAATEFVSSTASVYESRSDSNASWRRGTSAAGEQCLRTGVRSELRGSGARLESFRRLAFPRRGDGSIAFRTVASQQGIRVYVDVVAIHIGRAQVAVIYSSAVSPPPPGELRRLTGLIAARAAKAMRTG